MVSTLSFANDKLESIYNAKQHQQFCQGKTEVAEVSFAYRGIICNGTCQLQFSPTKTARLKGDEAELRSVCSRGTTTKTASIAGQKYTGKCALGYTPPMPKT